MRRSSGKKIVGYGVTPGVDPVHIRLECALVRVISLFSFLGMEHEVGSPPYGLFSTYIVLPNQPSVRDGIE